MPLYRSQLVVLVLALMSQLDMAFCNKATEFLIEFHLTRGFEGQFSLSLNQYDIK